jgi:hypothetical protein
MYRAKKDAKELKDINVVVIDWKINKGKRD